MIDINLIPLSMRKDSQGNAKAVALQIPPEILIGVGGAVIALLLLVHLILGGMWLMNMGHLSVCKSQWDKLATDKSTLDRLNDDLKKTKDRYNLLSGLTTQKCVFWSSKFNAISDALSKGLWLRRMELNKDGVFMEGSVVSKSRDEVANVGLFITSLKENNDFIKDFASLEVNSIQREKNSAVEVTDFTVTAKLK